MDIEVKCHAGYKGEQTPRTLVFGAREVAVTRVLDMWLAPEHRYFKLVGDDGYTYIVRHDMNTGEWEMTMASALDGAAPGRNES
ncbi:MAG: hypothetical protein ACLFOY_12560 [Desulfatibacillaceae bacterium]